MTGDIPSRVLSTSAQRSWETPCILSTNRSLQYPLRRRSPHDATSTPVPHIRVQGFHVRKAPSQTVNPTPNPKRLEQATSQRQPNRNQETLISAPTFSPLLAANHASGFCDFASWRRSPTPHSRQKLWTWVYRVGAGWEGYGYLIEFGLVKRLDERPNTKMRWIVLSRLHLRLRGRAYGFVGSHPVFLSLRS